MSKNKTASPKVSVILSSYNQEQYLAAAIQSVLNQTFSDFELLIFDDGSTDGSQEIIKSFSDDRIKLFLYEKNRGAVEATKEPLQSARGKYIAIHHSDDVWQETKLEKQVDFLEKNPDYAACFTQVDFIDESGEIYDLPQGHPYKNVFSVKNRSREEWLNHLFWKMSSFCNPSSLLVNDGRYFELNQSLFQLTDYFMWINVCKQKNIYILEEKLTKFRLRRTVQNSMSSITLEKTVRNANESYFTAKEFLPLCEKSRDFLKVFPEAEKYAVGGKIEPKFAFAKLCLKHSQPAYNKLGLEILYDLLAERKTADKLKKLYDYDFKSFIKDTAACDVFGIEQKLNILRTRLYFDFGEDFEQEKSLSEKVMVDGLGKFFVRFESSLKSPVLKLRFDPDENKPLLLKLNKILINGEEVVADFGNEIKTLEDGSRVFCSSDPWLVIDKKIDAPNLQVDIFGEVDFAAAKDEADKIFHEQTQTILNQTQTIAEQSQTITYKSQTIEYQSQHIANLTEKIDYLEKELKAIATSRSWKMTKPLRDAGVFIKKILK